MILPERLLRTGARAAGNGQFQRPGGIALDSKGYVYVVDQDNYRVQKFDSSGGYVTQWGSRGQGDGLFGGPVAIAIDRHDTIYVTDRYTDKVEVFDADGRYIRSVRPCGAGTERRIVPTGIAADKNGRVLISDSYDNAVQVFNEDGTFGGYLGGAGVVNGTFRLPNSIAVDATGDIYVEDEAGLQRLDRTGCCPNVLDRCQLNRCQMLGSDANGDCYTFTGGELSGTGTPVSWFPRWTSATSQAGFTMLGLWIPPAIYGWSVWMHRLSNWTPPAKCSAGSTFRGWQKTSSITGTRGQLRSTPTAASTW